MINVHDQLLALWRRFPEELAVDPRVHIAGEQGLPTSDVLYSSPWWEDNVVDAGLLRYVHICTHAGLNICDTHIHACATTRGTCIRVCARMLRNRFSLIASLGLDGFKYSGLNSIYSMTPVWLTVCMHARTLYIIRARSIIHSICVYTCMCAYMYTRDVHMYLHASTRINSIRHTYTPLCMLP